MAETNLMKMGDAQVQKLSPEQMIAEATNRANLIKKIVDSRGLKKRIGTKDHVYYEAWSLVARFYGKEVSIDASRELKDKDEAVIGYEATACLVDLETKERGPTAHSRCMVSEANWKGKDLYAVESMAQTRAAGKLCRLNLGWVMVLAGFSGMPAEETDNWDAPKSYGVKKGGKQARKPDPEPVPLAVRIEKGLAAFADLGIAKETIEAYFDLPSDSWDEGHLEVLVDKCQMIKSGAYAKEEAFVKAEPEGE